MNKFWWEICWKLAWYIFQGLRWTWIGIIATAFGWLLCGEYWLVFVWWRPLLMSYWVNALVIISAAVIAVLLLYLDHWIVRKFEDFMDDHRYRRVWSSFVKKEQQKKILGEMVS